MTTPHDIVVIDYGSGNLHSIVKALQVAAGEKRHVALVNDANAISCANHIVLPGVGAFGDCIKGLKDIEGAIEVLEQVVLKYKKPFLGICVGMQMLAKTGSEHGQYQGLGWIDAKVVPIAEDNNVLKIPHMGWNELAITHQHPLLDGLENGTHVYFVHSYFMQCTNDKDVLATIDYGKPLTAAIARDNIVATQFHPEKSHHAGLTLLRNFIAM